MWLWQGARSKGQGARGKELSAVSYQLSDAYGKGYKKKRDAMNRVSFFMLLLI